MGEIQKTLSIIKPDCMSKGLAGRVLDLIESNGYRLCAAKMIWLTRPEAEGFYAEHKGKEFFGPLVEFMSSNPCIPIVVSGPDAIAGMRRLMGKTDPSLADPGTIRKLFASDGRHNIIHGSDSPSSAAREIAFFFSEKEIFSWEPREYRK